MLFVDYPTAFFRDFMTCIVVTTTVATCIMYRKFYCNVTFAMYVAYAHRFRNADYRFNVASFIATCNVVVM